MRSRKQAVAVMVLQGNEDGGYNTRFFACILGRFVDASLGAMGMGLLIMDYGFHGVTMSRRSVMMMGYIGGLYLYVLTADTVPRI